INYYDGTANQTATVNLAASANAPALLTASDGPSYDYQTHPDGSHTDHTFTITNVGGTAATGISGNTPSAPFSYGGGGPCPGTLPPADWCRIVPPFSPTTRGRARGQIGANYNGGVPTQQVTRNVGGTGAAPATLSFSDPNFDYMGVVIGTSSDHTFM